MLLLASLLVVSTGCDSLVGSDDDDDVGEHLDADRVDIYLDDNGERGELIAIYSDDLGWTDADNEPIDALANPVLHENGERGPLQEGGEPARLRPVFYDNQGEVDSFVDEVIALDTEEPGVQEQYICSEYTSRFATENDPDQFAKIGFPNEVHPAAQNDPQNNQFAQLSTGEWVLTQGCDHVNIYPEEAGDLNLRFLLWHVDHSDDDTGFIEMTVEPAE